MPYTETTTITSYGVVFFSIMGILMLVLPRRIALLPILATTCYITLGQQIVVASLNFSIMRLIILAGWIRIFIRREYRLTHFNAIDKVIILWVLSAVVTYTVLYRSSEAFVNRLGFAYNALGMYFLFRFLIRDFEEARRVIKMIAIIIVPLAMLMLLEKATGRNAFSIFGGVPEMTEIRGGKLRCQGPFSHPILAGTFGATFMPLCYGLWKEGRGSRVGAILGLSSSTMITLLSASSGPAMAYAAGVGGWIMWRFRRHLKPVVWGTAVALVMLDLFIMKSRVWFLIDRVSDLVGSSGHGWYRAKVIDEALKHFNEWWLIGAKYTAHWDLIVLPAYPDKADITNQFVTQGIDGGLITAVLFIMVIVFCFRAIGGTIRMFDVALEMRMILWALGVSLLAHIASFLSVTYFDQMVVFWYLLLASISSVTGDLVVKLSPIMPANSLKHSALEKSFQ